MIGIEICAALPEPEGIGSTRGTAFNTTEAS